MTICIAAIGKSEPFNENKEVIVFATDHMISLPLGEFEYSVEKFKKVNKNTITMLAGDPTIFNTVIKDIKPEDTFDTIEQKIYQNMKKVKKTQIENILFEKFQISYEDIKEILTLPEINETAENLLSNLNEFSLASVILLIGFNNSKAQISEINEMQSINVTDTINFDAIGTGGTQAINTLLFQRHSRNDSLKTTLYNVYKAKRNSEVAQGVGSETDIFILTNEGIMYKVSESQIKELDRIYKEEMNFGKYHVDIDKIIKNLGERDV